jgi:hypothetical protein
MDVKGAFDHVNHRRLLITMVAKTLEGDLIEWAEDFITSRTMQVTVAGFGGGASEVNTGISQGSPVSPILFAMCLLCLFPFGGKGLVGVEGISFADDVGWRVSRKDIGDIKRKIDRCVLLSQQWVQENSVFFDIDKTEAILLSRRRKHKRAFNETIQVARRVIKTFNTHAT